MKITNKTGKVIGIANHVLLPGETVRVDNKDADTPVLKKFAKSGLIEMRADNARSASKTDTKDASKNEE